MKYIASVSFGKDSLTMLLLLIEKKYPLDEIVFYDTGKEFQAIYDTRDKMLPILKENNIKYVELKPITDFDYLMFEKPVRKRGTDIVYRYGYGWCGGGLRWGTGEKIRTIKKYTLGSYEYVGIAYDEQKRLEKERRGNISFPLADWKMTEIDCLNYCYSQGFYWLEDGIRLYDVLDRVSCYCCRNKNLKELANIYNYLPRYWQKLKNIQSNINDPFRKDCSIFDLESRFKEVNINGNLN